MTYEEFCSNVQEDIADYVASYNVQNITIIDVQKEGGVELKGLVIHEEGVLISPTIYLESFYKEYDEEFVTYEETLGNIAAEYERHRNPELDFSPDKFKDFEQIKDSIVPMVLNTESNQNILDTLPHKTFEDLSIIYKVHLGSNDEYQANIKINNQILGAWGVKLDEVAKIAEENVKTVLPPSIKSMLDVLKEMAPEGIPDEIFEAMVDEQAPPQIIVTNTQKANGAYYMLDTEVMDRVAEKLGGDVVVLPSSIHECICCPMTDINSLDAFKQMVEEVNNTQVEPQDRLSYEIYCYDASAHKLMSAENYALNKSQDLSNKVTL